jgi:hypothetical protein
MNPDTTIVSGIVCNPCGKELPPMTMTEHLNGGGCPCQKLTRPPPKFQQVQAQMPPSPIQTDYVLAADRCLAYYWGHVYSSLVDNPTDRYWYVDDRADPKNFWILLAIAQPDLWMMVRGKTHIPIGHLAKAVRFMKNPERRPHIEQMIRAAYV